MNGHGKSRDSQLRTELRGQNLAGRMQKIGNHESPSAGFARNRF
jgi:hypothetical protein